jgi:hypothetical protein
MTNTDSDETYDRVIKPRSRQVIGRARAERRQDHAAKRLRARQNHFDETPTMNKDSGYHRPGSYKK